MTGDDDFFVSNYEFGEEEESKVEVNKVPDAQNKAATPYYNEYLKAKSERVIQVEENSKKCEHIKKEIKEFKSMTQKAFHYFDAKEFEEARYCWQLAENIYENKIPAIKSLIIETFSNIENAVIDENCKWSQYEAAKENRQYITPKQIADIKERYKREREYFEEEVLITEKLYLHFRDEQQLKSRLLQK